MKTVGGQTDRQTDIQTDSRQFAICPPFFEERHKTSTCHGHGQSFFCNYNVHFTFKVGIKHFSTEVNLIQDFQVIFARAQSVSITI